MGEAKEIPEAVAKDYIMDSFLSRKTIYLDASNNGTFLFFQHAKARFRLPDLSFTYYLNRGGIDVGELRSEAKFTMPVYSYLKMNISLGNFSLDAQFSSIEHARLEQAKHKQTALSYKGEGIIMGVKVDNDFGF